ncbi:MAG: glycoside hydrolase family 65 protein [Chloroflexi bacterium]|nr:glycoside hydrolase family 65 protein [Chloroflexota bacterium]
MRELRDRPRGATPSPTAPLPPELRRPYRLIAFDWDGTAVMGRKEDAGPVRERVEQLLRYGVRVVVITGTNFDNIDRQLSAGIRGPHKQRLYLCTNRGSEVYGFDARSRPIAIKRRAASPEEDRLLSAVAERVRDWLLARGVAVEIIYNRLNRRKIDLIPAPEWAEPPKSAIGELLQAVETRLHQAGVEGGIREVLALTGTTAHELGLQDPRMTTDVKHVEVGLTDKGDSVAWVMAGLAPQRRIAPQEVLILGDEFGPIAGFEGSDALMRSPAAEGATFASVGPEPGGAPPGVLHLGGGPPRFRHVLDEQLAHLRELQPEPTAFPESAYPPTPDPTWLLELEGFDPAREHEIESLLTISNGYLGTRGSLEEVTESSKPATFLAGVFDVGSSGEGVTALVRAPDWTMVCASVEGEPLRLEHGEVLELRRTLDLHRGLLLRRWRHRGPSGRVTRVETLRFVSLADRHLGVELVRLEPENYTGQVRLESALDGRGLERHWLAKGAQTDHLLLLRGETRGSRVRFAYAAANPLLSAAFLAAQETASVDESWASRSWEWEAEVATPYHHAKVVACSTSRDADDPEAAAREHLSRALQAGPSGLLAEHVEAWAERWEAADVEIEGDRAAQRALRFALYHLIAAANDGDERVSVGARAMTGESYLGHVFWDTEIFVLPFYIFTHPPTARAVLMYRYHTLQAAREKAQRLGYKGALWAWESAATGEETTPSLVVFPTGEVVPILTAAQEHHIAADVVYGAWQYWRATGDDQFFLEAGAEMILEASRFWASRSGRGDDGKRHIRTVIGPDEYHEGVDDNAYTNALARWTLQRGVETVCLLQCHWPERWEALSRELRLGPTETDEWQEVADNLVQGRVPGSNLIEQFTGYFTLEPIDLKAYEPRTVPMDVILGRKRTQASQVVKQADVVMLLHLLHDQFTPQERRENFEYYEPRTGHGSSLSPAIHAAVAARLGEVDLAERYLRQAAEIDLANNMGNAAGGVHIAALGGMWQAVVLGIAGVSVREYGLSLSPHLPRSWRRLSFPIQWRGRHVRLFLTGEPLRVEAVLERGSPMLVTLEGGPEQELQPGKRYVAELHGQQWTTWREVAA